MCEQPEKSFQEAFTHFISSRVSEDMAELYLSNSEYIRMGLDIGDCCDEIISNVPKEKQEELGQLIDKYTGVCGLREALVNEILYIQGLRDGVELGRILKTGKGGV